jgi:putative membrane protein (TIGR04086 family)
LAAIGGSALLGTVVTNLGLWLSRSSGLTLQEAYARDGFDLTSPTELLSIVVLLCSGMFGGYVSAMHGAGRHLAQGLAAGAITCLFFLAMSFGSSNTRAPGWYVALHLALAILSGVLGGYVYARRA